MESTITVQRNDAKGRYEIHDGDAFAGYLTIEQAEGKLVLPHTRIFDEFGGRGLAGILVERALTDIAERGETIVPLCPYVVAWLGKNTVQGLDIDWPAG